MKIPSTRILNRKNILDMMGFHQELECLVFVIFTVWSWVWDGDEHCATTTASIHAAVNRRNCCMFKWNNGRFAADSANSVTGCRWGPQSRYNQMTPYVLRPALKWQSYGPARTKLWWRHNWLEYYSRRSPEIIQWSTKVSILQEQLLENWLYMNKWR